MPTLFDQLSLTIASLQSDPSLLQNPFLIIAMLLPRRLYSAFSLTELLVAVILILILSILAFPIAKAVRDHNNSARCVSNLKQVGTALLASTIDRSGYLMPRNLSNAPTAADRYWNTMILHYGYIENPNTLYCPGFHPYNNNTPGIYTIDRNIGQCYGMRDWQTKAGNNFGEFKPLSAIEHPSEFFLIGDSYWKSINSQGYALRPGAADHNTHIHLRHPNNTANLFYADGSVRATDRATIEEKFNILQQPYGRTFGFLVWPTEQ